MTVKVTPRVYEKVKQWHSEGRIVYRVVCANLGCLAECYSPHNPRIVKVLCPACGIMGGGFWHAEGTVMPAELEPAEPVIIEVTAKDLEFNVDTRHPSWAAFMSYISIVLEVPKAYWRPILLPHGTLHFETVEESDGYLEKLTESLGDGSWLQENWSYVADVLSRYNIKLVKEGKLQGDFCD